MALPTARRRRLRGLCSHVAGAMSESKPLFVSLDGTEVELEEQLLGDLCEVLCLGAQSPADLPDDVLARADIIAVWHTIWIDEALVKKIANAKLIVRMGVPPALFVQLLPEHQSSPALAGVGYDNVDTVATGKAGIVVCNIPN